MLSALKRFWNEHALVRLYVINVAAGFVLSTAFVAWVLSADVFHLAHIFAAADAWGFVVLLWFFVGLTFASVQAGMAVMLLEKEERPGGGKRYRLPRLVPARLPAPAVKKAP